jgi:hypothetical protein
MPFMNDHHTSVDRCYWIVLPLVLLLALSLRLYGLHWGVPDVAHPKYSFHPDEAFHIEWARKLVAGEITKMHFMYGGTLHFSILNAYYRYGQLLANMLGGVSPIANAILFGRYCVVGVSVLTILLLAEIGRRLFGPMVAAAAALLLAIVPAHLFLAQTVRPDEVATLLTVLMLYLSVRILQSAVGADHREFLLAGVLLGAMMALRFPLAVFAIAPVTARWLKVRPATPRAWMKALLDRRVMTMVGMAPLFYVLFSPHTLMHWQFFVDGMRMQSIYQAIVFEDAIGRGPGVYQYGVLILREALGTPIYACALAGVVMAAYRRTPALLLLLAAGAPYFILTTFASWVMVRYALPIVPLLALLAAVWLVAAVQWAGRMKLFVIAGAVVAVVWTLLADTALLRVEAGQNVREQASAWLRDHLASGAGVVSMWQYDDDVFFNPAIPPELDHGILLLMPGIDLEAALAPQKVAYLIVNEPIYANMERLGERHPRQQVRALGQLLKSGKFQLLQEFKLPVKIFGIDFSDRFESQDFLPINPGIRVYQRVSGS